MFNLSSKGRAASVTGRALNCTDTWALVCQIILHTDNFSMYYVEMMNFTVVSTLL